MDLLPAVLTMFLMAGAAQTSEPQALVEARALYNAGDYAEAVKAALAAREIERAADAAELVRARSLLELYRLRGDQQYLEQARIALNAVHAPALSARDRVDLLVGLGQSLYLEGSPGAAAEIFDSVLSAPPVLDGPERLRVLEWWATAMDRDAQSQPADRRVRIYQRMVERMEVELRIDPSSPAANYWLAVGARGTGDVARAWRAAIAGWVRATLAPDATARVRADLDKLVVEALVPERVRTVPAPERDKERARLLAEWEGVKKRWPDDTEGPRP